MRALHVLCAIALVGAGCESADGFSLACEESIVTETGTLRVCDQEYGIPEFSIDGFRAACTSYGAIVDACSPEGATATCSETLPTAEGEITIRREYLYTDTVPEGGPTVLDKCPYWL